MAPMVVPCDCLHDMDDDDLNQYIRVLRAHLSTTDTTTILARSPLVQIGQMEQERRPVRYRRDAVAAFGIRSAGELISLPGKS